MSAPDNDFDARSTKAQMTAKSTYAAVTANIQHVALLP